MYLMIFGTAVITSILGAVGLGSATYLVILYTFFDMPIRQAIAIGLVINVISLFTSVAVQSSESKIDKKMIALMVAVALPLCHLGIVCSAYLNDLFLKLAYIVFLIYTFISLLMVKYKNTSDLIVDSKRIKLNRLRVSSFSGFMAGLFGVGGGNIILPNLLKSGLDLKEATKATTLLVIMISTYSMLGHLGDVDFNVDVFLLLVASILGGWLSNRIRQIVNRDGVIIFVSCLVVFSIIRLSLSVS